MRKNNNTTADAPPAMVPVAPDEAITPEVRAWIENKVVRTIRDIGWCDEANRALMQIFPEGSVHGSDMFLASDGLDCWGNGWRDTDGFDVNGFDRDGYDRDGYDRDGYDRDGFNRDGYDSNGMHRDSPERFRFDRYGRDAEGFSRNGRNEAGRTREEETSRAALAAILDHRYDENGRDPDGYTYEGYAADGAYSREHDRYNRNGAYASPDRAAGEPVRGLVIVASWQARGLVSDEEAATVGLPPLTATEPVTDGS